jgi:hypothetical protein
VDTDRFDTRTRSLSNSKMLSRRAVVGTLGLGALGLPGLAEAKKRKRKKKKKVKFNRFGCVNVGSFCKSSSQCCSGTCSGKKGKKTCAGHHSGGCTPARSLCATANLALSNCNLDNNLAQCFTTTGHGGFCADATPPEVPFENCQKCAVDADCVALGYPAGSACVIAEGPPGCDEAGCFGHNGSAGTACFPPGV